MIKWKEISACTHCSNYNKDNSYCKEHKKELTIYDELKGCEKISFTGNLSLELFKEIPEDSILRKLSIGQLAKSNKLLENNISSKKYGDYFNNTKSVNPKTNLSKTEKEGEAKIISFEKFKEAVRKFEEEEAFNSMLKNLPPDLK